MKTSFVLQRDVSLRIPVRGLEDDEPLAIASKAVLEVINGISGTLSDSALRCIVR